VAEIGPKEGEGRRVEFRLKDVTAAQVALVGSFTEWKPQPMTRSGAGWYLSVVLPPGSYQFAFLLDGQTWYLPKDSPGVVEDGFGRSNATIVIASIVTPAPL
jgi:1,4-alpha-glucan branching enzyme